MDPEILFSLHNCYYIYQISHDQTCQLGKSIIFHQIKGLSMFPVYRIYLGGPTQKKQLSLA